MKYTITINILEASEGRYIAFIEEIPGANTQGESIDEIKRNLFEILYDIYKNKFELKLDK